MTTITFRCYSCQKVLRVGADKAGKKARCVQCGTVSTIPMASEEVEEIIEAEVEPEPAPRSSSRNRDRGDTDTSRDRQQRSDAEKRPSRRHRDDEDEEVDDDDDRPRRRRRRDEEDEDDRPRKRSRYDDDDEDEDWDRPRKKKSTWAQVRLGLLLAFIGFCVMAGGYGVQGLGNLLFRINAGNAANIIFNLGVVVEVAGLITAVVGFVFWLFLPSSKYGILGFAIACVAVNGTYLLLQFISRLVPALNSFGDINRFDRPFAIFQAVAFWNSNLFQFIRGSTAAVIIGIILSQALIAAAFIMAAMYLSALGKNLKDRYLSGKATFLVIWSGCTSGYWVLQGILTIVLAQSAPTSRAVVIILGILQLIGFGMMVFQFVMFVLALHFARNQID